MRPSIALVTGGTDGVGKEIGLGLARAGVQVLVVGRSDDRGEAAARTIRTTTGNPHARFLHADVSLASDADRLVKTIIRDYPSLSYLVHSAGIVRGRRVLTSEGVESNFATNYLGRFVLSVGLLPLLETSGSPDHRSRILIISGAANGHVHFDDVNLTGRFGTLRAVLQFCQANDLFTVELAQRLARAAERRVAITCLKLGVVKTNIRREFPAWMKWLVPLVLDPLMALSASEAAEAALRLLQDPEFENASGALFQLIRRFKPIAIPASVQDPDARRRLWALSETLAVAARSHHRF